VGRSKRGSLSIQNVVFPDSIESEKFSRFENAEPSMNVTFRGITIDCNDDPQNASDSMRFNCDSDSNEIDESDLHSEKHDIPSTSTFRGMTIDCNEDNEHAKDSIRVNCEFDSNEIDESDLQLKKHFETRISTLRGITIDFKEVS
jgi:hypothetical protein